MLKRILTILSVSLLAAPVGAVSVPFTGTFRVEGRVAPGGLFFPSSLPFQWNFMDTGSGSAEVEFAGTVPQTVTLPSAAFFINEGNSFGGGFDPFNDPQLNNSLNARVDAGVFSNLATSPSASIAITSPSGGNYNVSAFPATDLEGETFGLDGGMVLPVGRIGLPGAVVNAGSAQFAELPPGPSNRVTYSWSPVPWTVTATGTTMRADSYGALNCSGSLSGPPTTCAGVSFGASLLLDLALAEGQAGFGPGTGETSLLGGIGVPGGLDILLDIESGEGLLNAAFEVATLESIEGGYGLLPFVLPGGAGAPTSLWRIAGGEQFQGTARLSFAYDPALLPVGYDETGLAIAHFDGVGWELLTGLVDAEANTITVETKSFSPFALVAVPEPGTVFLTAAGLTGLAVRHRRTS